MRNRGRPCRKLAQTGFPTNAVLVGLRFEPILELSIGRRFDRRPLGLVSLRS